MMSSRLVLAKRSERTSVSSFPALLQRFPSLLLFRHTLSFILFHFFLTCILCRVSDSVSFSSFRQFCAFIAFIQLVKRQVRRFSRQSSKRNIQEKEGRRRWWWWRHAWEDRGRTEKKRQGEAKGSLERRSFIFFFSLCCSTNSSTASLVSCPYCPIAARLSQHICLHLRERSDSLPLSLCSSVYLLPPYFTITDASPVLSEDDEENFCAA